MDSKQIEKLTNIICAQFRDIYFSINNFSIGFNIDKHISSLPQIDLFKKSSKDFNSIEQHLHTMMTASYQNIVISFCNLYEKSGSHKGIFFQLKNELIKSNFNLDEYYLENRCGKIVSWFCKPYSDKKIIKARQKFGAHLDIKFDISKKFDEIFVSPQELYDLFWRGFRNWQYINNWLSNLKLIHFNSWTPFNEEYRNAYIDEITQGILKKLIK